MHLLLVWSSVTLLLLFAIPLFRLVPAFPTLPPQFNWQRWLFLPSIPLQVSWSIYPAALFCFSPYPSLANVRSDGQELVALKVSYSSLSAVVVFHWIYRVCARMYLCIRSILFRHSGGILSWFAVSLIIKLLSNKSKEFSPCMCRIILQFSFNFVPHFPLRLSVRLSVYFPVVVKKWDAKKCSTAENQNDRFDPIYILCPITRQLTNYSIWFIQQWESDVKGKWTGEGGFFTAQHRSWRRFFSVKYRGNKHQRGVWCSMVRPENKWQVTVSRYCEVLLIKEAETICQWMFVTRHNKSHEWNTWKENRQTPAWNPPTG